MLGKKLTTKCAQGEEKGEEDGTECGGKESRLEITTGGFQKMSLK